MNFLGLLQPILGPAVNKALDLIPNKNERARAEEEFQKALLEAVRAADNAQAEVNKIEAAHNSIFVAGWRPAIGWMCALALGWTFLAEPTLTWVAVTFGVAELTELPAVDSDPLFQLVLAMLGIAGLRTFEKVKHVARER
jgi:hypothetical protein